MSRKNNITKLSNIPFVYFLRWNSLNMNYYGCRYANNCHPSDLWTTYFTSSDYVSEFIVRHGEPDLIQVRKIFIDEDPETRVLKCRVWENKVLTHFNAASSPLWLNKHNGGKKLSTYNLTCAIDTQTGLSLGAVSCDDERFNTGTIIHPNTLTAYAKNTTTNEYLGRVHRNDPRWFTGEICSTRIGKAAAFDSKTNTYIGLIDTSDPRWESDEIRGATRGQAPAILTSTGESLGNIDRNDSRWETGEIISTTTGYCCAYDSKTGEKISRVSVNDPRWKTGELVGKKWYYTQDGTLVKAFLDDPRLIAGIIKTKKEWQSMKLPDNYDK